MKSEKELNVLKEEVETLNKKLAELTEDELAQVSGGVEWSVPENGLPRPSRDTEPENYTTGWTPSENEEWKFEISEPKLPTPGTYELHGVVWGQD